MYKPAHKILDVDVDVWALKLQDLCRGRTEGHLRNVHLKGF